MVERKFRVWLSISLLIAFSSTLSAISSPNAQIVTISLYVDSDSLTLYLADDRVVSLAGLGFEYVDDGERYSLFLDEFEDFAVLRLNEIPAPICLRLERFESAAPLPLVCRNVPQVIQTLVRADIFWYEPDSRATRSLVLVRRAEPIQICTPSQIPCVIPFEPIVVTSVPSRSVPTVNLRTTSRPETSTPQPTLTNPGSCGNGLPWRLQIGYRGRVNLDEPTPSTVRSQPGAPQGIGFLQPGEEFTVVDGPRCTSSNGVSWWFLRADNGLSGWVSEGNEVYWIEPVS